MLYLVEMEVDLPHDLDPDDEKRLKEAEREYSRVLQERGTWRHLWRVAGRYANVSVFDAESHDELHNLLSGLPFFPHLTVRVTPLVQHPSRMGVGSTS